MAAATCTVTRSGGKTGHENDSERLGMVLNEDNLYTASFNGTIIHFENSYAYVVKETANTIHLVKLKELSNVVAVFA